MLDDSAAVAVTTGQLRVADAIVPPAHGWYTSQMTHDTPGQLHTACLSHSPSSPSVFSVQVDRRFGSQGLHANSVMPGVIFTPLARHLDPAMVKAFETPYYQKLQKNAAQGAATTVWAAISKECEGKGGKYLEDCGASKPREDGKLSAGYASHAYDEEAAQRLWDLSLKLVGMPDTTI